MSLIKSRNEILHDIYTELSEFKNERNLSVENNIHIISFNESKDDFFPILYDFICENYYTNSNFRWRYSPELLRYFLKDSIVVVFYINETNSTNNTNQINNKIICGMVVGKPIDIMYYSNFDFPVVSRTVDVNFLCIRHNLRGFGICKFLKDVLIKSVIENDSSINSALFTIGSNKMYNMYSQKHYYSKMLKDDCLQELITENLKINIFLDVEMSEQILLDIKNDIYDDNIKRYDIFQTFDKDSLNDIMKNKDFIKIFITNQNNTTNKIEIVAMVILYHLDFEDNGKLFTNAFVYNYFIKTKVLSEETLWNFMEYACKSIGINVITTTTQLNDTYMYTGINLKYYDYNLGLKTKYKNGLVTI